MRKIFLVLVGMLFCLSGCAPTPKEKALALVSTGAVSAELVGQIQEYVEAQLKVPVRLSNKPAWAKKTGVSDLKKVALRAKSDADVVYIVIASAEGSEDHLQVFEEDGVAVINVAPLATDDVKKFDRRVERQVMRAAAFLFGLPPTPDPFCVTRNYSSLEDLDRMGRNYSPPWQGRYAKEAAARGLLPLQSENDAPRQPPSL
jgi:predicted Zn-dependent protease